MANAPKTLLLSCEGLYPTLCSKLVASKDKEVNQAARDSDDALVCCVEKMVEERIMDSGASFHATYCKEELERFKLCSGKVHLAYDKSLDIAGVRDVVLKTSFGTSWTLKDVWYIPGLKRRYRFISGSNTNIPNWHLECVIYFVRSQFFESHEVARENKRGSLYMAEVHPEGIGAIIDGSGEEGFLHNVREDKETAEAATRVAVGNNTNLQVPKTPLQFGVAERLSRTFRAESTGLRVEAPKMLWVDSVSMSYLIYRIPYVSIGLRIPEEEWRGNDTSLVHLKVFGWYEESPGYPKQIYHICGLNLWARAWIEFSKSLRAHVGAQIRVRGPKTVGASRIVEDQMNKTVKTKYSPGREAPRFHRISAGKKASQSLWMFKVDDMLVAGFDMAEFNKPKWLFPLVFKMNGRYSKKQNLKFCSWAKLVRLLISEGSLSLLKILGMKSLADMFTRLVMKEKLKLYAASTGLRDN
nr:hypothetical protein [Tanacetum cinerariifolium]